MQLVPFFNRPSHLAYVPPAQRRHKRPCRSLRNRLFALVAHRDGCHCLECYEATDLVLDHWIPLAAGGSNHPSNLQLLCSGCNTLKSMWECYLMGLVR